MRRLSLRRTLCDGLTARHAPVKTEIGESGADWVASCHHTADVPCVTEFWVGPRCVESTGTRATGWWE
jgi:hypothetical protein